MKVIYISVLITSELSCCYWYRSLTHQHDDLTRLVTIPCTQVLFTFMLGSMFIISRHLVWCGKVGEYCSEEAGAVVGTGDGVEGGAHWHSSRTARSGAARGVQVLGAATPTRHGPRRSEQKPCTTHGHGDTLYAIQYTNIELIDFSCNTLEQGF